jgi:rare lipoprotein A
MEPRTKLVLKCVVVQAISLLVASGVLEANESTGVAPDAKIDGSTIERSRSEITLAALSPTPVDATNAKLDNRIELDRASTEPDNSVSSLPSPDNRVFLSSSETIIGIASFYDYPQKTASGEQYDPTAFTAAAQLKIRGKFGGIRFGRLYQPAYAVAEYENKKVILKFNDVGPLRPGRQFDLSRAAMTYFNGIEKGLLQDFKVTLLPLGQIYPAGPVTDAQLVALGIVEKDVELASAHAAFAQEPSAAAPEAAVSPAVPVEDPAAPPTDEIAVLIEDSEI